MFFHFRVEIHRSTMERFPSGQRDQTVNLSTMERFPSGQRDQTVNLTALPSKVRILLSPKPSSEGFFCEVCFGLLFFLPKMSSLLLRRARVCFSFQRRYKTSMRSFEYYPRRVYRNILPSSRLRHIQHGKSQGKG